LKILTYHRALFALLLSTLFMGIETNAQQSNSIYLMHGIPQSSFLNPAVQIECRWFLGIPGLSSSHVAYSNTAFTYRDLTEGESWNLEQVESQMHRVDLYGSELSLQLLALGYRHKSSYFSFSVDDRSHLYQTVPGKLAATVVNGNYPAAGTYTAFNALKSYGTYFRQFTLGASRVLSRSLNVGIRLKLLFGKAGISSGRTDIGLYTDENNFDLLADGNYIMNTSFPLSVEQDAEGNITGITINEINYASFFLNRGNPGVAIDLGIVYRYDPKLTLSASLLDVGGLRWRTDLNKLSSEGRFIYEALESSGDLTSMSFLEDMIDTLQSSFDVSVSQQAYFSLLPAQLFLGGSYQYKEHLSLGAVSRNLFLRSKLYSSFSLSATADLNKRIFATLSWSYLNRSIRNIGAVLALQGKGFQFHLASENLLGFFQPFDTRTIQFRAGFNVLFGCPGSKKEKLEADAYAGYPAGGNCSWSTQQKQRKKRYRRKVGL